MNCDTGREWILKDLDDDLTAAARADLHAHLGGCAGCAAFLDQERTLRRLLAESRSPEAPEVLLQSARAALTEAIARELPPGARPAAAPGTAPVMSATSGQGGRSWWGRLSGAVLPAGFRLSPVAATTLIVLGIVIGAALPRIGSGGPGRPGAETPGEAATVDDVPGSTGTVAVRDLVAGSEAGTVRVAYDLLRRGALTGPPDDPRIRRLLVDTLRDNPNDGLRLEAIEALGGQVNQVEARDALLRTILEDRNTGARLSAIDALAARAADDGTVRRAMIEALQRDANPGVRVRAIDALAAAPHPDVIPALRRLAREDRNDYVRIRAAALVGEAASGVDR